LLLSLVEQSVAAAPSCSPKANPSSEQSVAVAPDRPEEERESGPLAQPVFSSTETIDCPGNNVGPIIGKEQSIRPSARSETFVSKPGSADIGNHGDDVDPDFLKALEVLEDENRQPDTEQEILSVLYDLYPEEEWTPEDKIKLSSCTAHRKPSCRITPKIAKEIILDSVEFFRGEVPDLDTFLNFLPTWTRRWKNRDLKDDVFIARQTLRYEEIELKALESYKGYTWYDIESWKNDKDYPKIQFLFAVVHKFSIPNPKGLAARVKKLMAPLEFLGLSRWIPNLTELLFATPDEIRSWKKQAKAELDRAKSWDLFGNLYGICS